MPDPEHQEPLPGPVSSQVRKAHQALDASLCERRKPDTREKSVHEIDVWADAGSVAAIGSRLEAAGFLPFRPARSGRHRFFLWYGAGWWVKVDVKLRQAPRPTPVSDLAWLARRRRGAIVALLGADGAGKSTTSACIEASMPVDVQIAYLGSRPSGPSDPDHQEDRRDPSAIRQAAGLAKWLVTTGLRLAGLAITARRGTIVICDRHPIEAGIVGDEPSVVKAAKRSFVRRLMPPPDLLVLLAATGEVLHQRKGEHDPLSLDRMTEAWRTVVDEFDGVEVDAAASAQTVCQTVQRHIWDLIKERRLP